MSGKHNCIKQAAIALSLTASISTVFAFSVNAADSSSQTSTVSSSQTSQSSQSASSAMSDQKKPQDTSGNNSNDSKTEISFPAHVIANRAMNQRAQINDSARNDGTFTKGPALTSNDTLLANSNGSQYDGHIVTVLELATTLRDNGRQYNYVKLQDESSQNVFWIDERAILSEITNRRAVNYQAIIQTGDRNDDVFTNGPALSSWESLTSNGPAKNFNGHQVTVLQEADTLRGNGNRYTYLQVHDPVSNQDYWLDQRALLLNQYAEITNQRNVDQYAQLVGQRKDGIYSGPALTSLDTLTAHGQSSNYQGRYFQVTQISTTQRANGRTYEYAKVTDPQSQQSFWIDSRSLAISDYASIVQRTAVNQTAIIRDSYRNDAVYSDGPALTSVTALTANEQGRHFDGHTVTVLQAIRTRRTNGREYDYDQIKDGNRIYWIDQRAILATAAYKKVNYQAIINTRNRTDNFFFNGPALTSWDALTSSGSDKGSSGRTVQVLQEASTERGDGNSYTYLKVRDGLSVYWLDKRAFLFPNQSVMLGYTHFNQNREGAPEGCEGTSLQIALSTKGRSLSLRQIYNASGYGWRISPYDGFHGNPFGGGRYETQTIYAAPFARATKRFYSGIEDISGASVNDVIYQLQQGNPVITWASYSWTVNPANFHVMCIVGYRPGAFRIADPAPYLFGNSYWISTDTWYRVNQNEKAVGFTTPRGMNVVVK